MVGKRLLIGRKKMTGNVRLEAHVRTKTLDVGGGKRREQTQLVEAGEGTLQPTIVADGARLEIVDVRMALELGERETVDIEALDVAGIDGEVPLTFIRAPRIIEVHGDAKALAEVDGRIVAARQGNQLGVTFHPELDEDTRLHELFLQM